MKSSKPGPAYGTLDDGKSSEKEKDADSSLPADDNPNRAERFFRFWFPSGSQTELRTLLSLGWPTMLTLLARFMMQSVSIIMCGHLSKYELSAAALANSLFNVLGLNIGGGMATACDTLFSQTYGSENKKGVGVFLQRALLCEYAVLIILCSILMNTEPILILLRQNPVVATMAQTYVTLLLPGLFFDFTFMVLSRYLQCQNCVIPPMICAIIGSICNAISQYLTIFVFGFRYQASAVCQMGSFGVMFFGIVIYTIASKKYEETWDGWNLKEALKFWGLFYKYAIPGLLLIAMEAWSYEIATVVAGMIGLVQLGAQAIIFQFDMWGFLVPFSMSIAVNIRIGQELGSGNGAGAKYVYRVGLSAILVLATTLAIVVISMKDYLPKIFSNNMAIVALTAKAMPIFALFIYFDGIAHISSGALRGCGKQHIAAIMTFVGFYVVGMPIALPLTLLTNLKILGMWIGLCCGIAVEALLNCIMVLNIKWDKESEKAIENAYSTMSCTSTAEDESDTEKTLLKTKGKSTRAKQKAKAMIETKDVDFKMVLLYRLIFLLLLGALLAGAIIFRIYLPKPWRHWCMPYGNTTLLYNDTDPVCVKALAIGLKRLTPSATSG